VVGLVEDGILFDGAVQLDGRCGPVRHLLGHHVHCTGIDQGNRESLGRLSGRVGQTISHFDINRD